MYKTGNSNAGWSLLFVSTPTHPPPPPISQPHSSALSCFVSHKVLTMGVILIPCVFWLLASSRYWQEDGGKERDGKVTVCIPPPLFLLGLMFEDGYVAIPMLHSCVTAPLGNTAPFSCTFKIGMVTVICYWYILASQSVLLPLTIQLSLLFCTWSGHYTL